MTKIELYLRPLITLTNLSIKNVAFVGGKGAAKPWGEWEEDALEFSLVSVRRVLSSTSDPTDDPNLHCNLG